MDVLEHPRPWVPRAGDRWIVSAGRTHDCAWRRVSRYAPVVSHVLEPASSGRAKCRGCGQPITRGELRFGERLPNPFADGEMTLWFHPCCAAFKRPEPLLEVFGQTAEIVPDREALEGAARTSLAHRRLPRIDGGERSPSGQAKCRSCKAPIAKGVWRIRLTYFEEGRFTAGGFVHLDCSRAYFEHAELLERVLCFSPDLGAEERTELERAYRTAPATPPAPPPSELGA